MAKLKAPLFSINASGSLAKAISYRSKGLRTIVGQINTHPDARTLPQVYHRWRFQDAVYYWKSLSDAQRATWESNARPTNMTGWAFMLQTYLAVPIDLMLHLRMDTLSGGLALDSSGHGNNGTNFGTTLVPGAIDLGLSFDGIDNRLNLGQPTDLLFTSGPFTILLFIYPFALDGNTRPFVSRGLWNTDGWLLWTSSQRIQFLTYQAGANQLSNTNAILQTNAWQHVAMARAGADADLFRNGIQNADVVGVHIDPLPAARDFYVGFNADFWFYLNAVFDEVLVYNRRLSDQQIAEIATERYYPDPII